MTHPRIEILAYEETELGPLCLRRRRSLGDSDRMVTEITLNHEFLMSSLHTESEQSLARLSLERCEGSGLRVLVGGLGLGYTALSALECRRVGAVEVVEFLPEVIGWMRDGLTPIASELNADARLEVRQGDIYGRLLAAPVDSVFHAILIDVDHSPEDQLAESTPEFYCEAGLRRATQHLQARGVLALWSYDRHSPLADAMRNVFAEVTVHPVRYYNQHVHEEFTDWLYIGRCHGDVSGDAAGRE